MSYSFIPPFHAAVVSEDVSLGKNPSYMSPMNILTSNPNPFSDGQQFGNPLFEDAPTCEGEGCYCTYGTRDFTGL